MCRSFCTLAVLATLSVAACQAPAPAAMPPPALDRSGMVIGTIAYAELGVPVASAHALVSIERLPQGGGEKAQHYLLAMELDARQQQGFFSGTLPAGVYALQEALGPGLRLVSPALRMPFEVTAGEVTDAGHYALEARAVSGAGR